MNEIKRIQIPEYIEKLADILPTDLYIVGGKVRNHLMNIDNDDIDLCSSMKLDELVSIILI